MVSIIAILTPAVALLVIHTIRGQAELTLRLERQMEISTTLTALSRETAVARECRLFTIRATDSDSTATLLALQVPASNGNAAGHEEMSYNWICYLAQRGRLSRTVFDSAAVPTGGDDAPSATNVQNADWRAVVSHRGQCLIEPLERCEFRIENGRLLLVNLQAAIERYQRIHSSGAQSAFALPAGTAVEQSVF